MDTKCWLKIIYSDDISNRVLYDDSYDINNLSILLSCNKITVPNEDAYKITSYDYLEGQGPTDARNIIIILVTKPDPDNRF
ncbi:hypothetical protein [Bacillus sp. AR18-7]|uniref:hypothetical protein n=1 Tax=Bacillus sp. AR18-7 TaxID=2217821 RepID=UPI0011CBD019|nr:hypothetical protein [Bacillus sp. AR18-7]TXR62164.1 hypothetical protein DN395_16785 [Bacillus sp. AR18-7]